jgi:hypothetical protein
MHEDLFDAKASTTEEPDAEKLHVRDCTLTITHNFRELRERPKGQIVDNKKGVADNKL